MSGSLVVSDLGESYRRYGQRWHRLCEWVSAGRVAWHQDFWALRGVTFAVASGESVGVIGLNGAGKTTLLKILTGTTQPTEGHVEIAGRVASLLELGIGFHPDFSGRQNAVMAGQLMGIPVQDLAALMPDIEAFAEIGQYIDQPVRTYSTGMAVRLAFAVAIAVRPEDWWDKVIGFQIVPGSESSFIGSARLPVRLRVERRPRIVTSARRGAGKRA